MASRYTGEQIAALREAADIESVAREYSELKPTSNGNLSGRCPFCSKDQFYVYTDRQFVYCFACGVAGDVINFFKRIEHLDFDTAFEKLTKRFGGDA